MSRASLFIKSNPLLWVILRWLTERLQRRDGRNRTFDDRWNPSVTLKVKWMDFTFPSQMIETWAIWNLSLMWASGHVRSSKLLPHELHPFPSVWWDGIYCLWDWWKITSVSPFFLSIRRGSVALMPRHGEKSDLALGSGMFLLRLWWVGPGRGHMKGSLCQAAKMFSLSLMKTRTHEQTWEHACHTLYEHQRYNTVDKLSIRLLFLDKVKRSISECVCCALKTATGSFRVKTSKDRQILCVFFFSLSAFYFSNNFLCLCGSTGELDFLVSEPRSLFMYILD